MSQAQVFLIGESQAGGCTDPSTPLTYQSWGKNVGCGDSKFEIKTGLSHRMPFHKSLTSVSLVYVNGHNDWRKWLHCALSLPRKAAWRLDGGAGKPGLPGKQLALM